MGLITISLLRNSALDLGIYEINRTGNNIKFFIDALHMERIQALASVMPGRITISAVGKPHIAIKLKIGENQLNVIQKALETMSKVEIES